MSKLLAQVAQNALNATPPKISRIPTSPGSKSPVGKHLPSQTAHAASSIRSRHEKRLPTTQPRLDSLQSPTTLDISRLRCSYIQLQKPCSGCATLPSRKIHHHRAHTSVTHMNLMKKLTSTLSLSPGLARCSPELASEMNYIPQCSRAGCSALDPVAPTLKVHAHVR